MKKHKIIYCCVILIITGILMCGCKLEHSHFEFIIEDFAELEQDEYTTSDNLSDYEIYGVVIRPWIKNISDDVTYGIGIYGYADRSASEKEITINQLSVCAPSGKELLNLTDYIEPIRYSNESSIACFQANNIAEFTDDVDTIKSYETLYVRLNATVSDKVLSESKDILYKIDIVAYVTHYTIT